jgi:hypothetical protein
MIEIHYAGDKATPGESDEGSGDLTGAFVFDHQEQPDVEPQLMHTEQDPAGTEGAPQSMQGSIRERTTVSSSGWSWVRSAGVIG